MGKTTHEIESEIVQARDRLGRDLSALERQIRETVDWRVRFRRNPAAFVGAAFGLGVLIGFLTIPAKPVR
jgi:ElaB/YqjD/DUF883 family membrane-anchored ribosome-binding protein